MQELMPAEALVLALASPTAAPMTRDEARGLVHECTMRARKWGGARWTLYASGCRQKSTWGQVEEDTYLGAGQQFIDRVLALV